MPFKYAVNGSRRGYCYPDALHFVKQALKTVTRLFRSRVLPEGWGRGGFRGFRETCGHLTRNEARSGVPGVGQNEYISDGYLEIVRMKTVRPELAQKFPGYRAAIKIIRDGMSPRGRTVDFLLDEFRRCTCRGETKKADVLSRAVLVLFPKGKVAIADARFRGYWQSGRRPEAVRVYHNVGRMFWYTEAVGRYYERQDQIGKAVREYQYFEDIFPGRGLDFLTMHARQVLINSNK